MPIPACFRAAVRRRWILPAAAPAGSAGRRCGSPLRRLKAIRAKAPKAKVEYNDGADPAAAAALAKASEVAIVFVNEPTSEGRDLRHA